MLLRILSRILRVYKPRGTERILRLIYPPETRYQNRLELAVEYDHQLLIQVDTASHIESDIFFYGYYEPETIRLIKRLIRSGFVAIDVGANIGSHTLIMGALVQSQGSVLAIEPHPTVFGRLVDNIRLNRLEQVRLYQGALDEFVGKAVLYSKPETFPNQGMANMYPGGWKPDTLQEIPITVQTLDNLVQAAGYTRLDFIKIDTEGNEYQVILGGRESIRKYLPYVLFEYADWTWKKLGIAFDSCRAFFADLNYTLYVTHPHTLSRLGSTVPPSANILAVPPLRDATLPGQVTRE
jgi:FkbM family methyltransferase